MPDNFPRAEHIFLLGRAHVVDDQIFAASTLCIGDQTNVVQTAVELPIDDVAGHPAGSEGKGSTPGSEEYIHIFDPAMVNVGVEFALWVEAHVTAFVLDDELLEIQINRPI